MPIELEISSMQREMDLVKLILQQERGVSSNLKDLKSTLKESNGFDGKLEPDSSLPTAVFEACTIDDDYFFQAQTKQKLAPKQLQRSAAREQKKQKMEAKAEAEMDAAKVSGRKQAGKPNTFIVCFLECPADTRAEGRATANTSSETVG